MHGEVRLGDFSAFGGVDEYAAVPTADGDSSEGALDHARPRRRGRGAMPAQIGMLPQPLRMMGMLLAARNDRADQWIQRGQQHARATALINLHDGGGADLLRRQRGLGPIKIMNQALLSAAQNRGMF
jgi:hypothetical protein